MNIIVFGELPIATKIVEFLSGFENVSVPCVVCENYKAKNADPWTDTPMLFDYAKVTDIPIVSLDRLSDFCEMNGFIPELGILARFSKVLKADHLNLFKDGVINLHGGLLPEYAGLYSINHMLLSGSKVGGGSIHWVDLGIDTGALIKRCTCSLNDNDTALSLHHKVQKSLYQGLVSILESYIADGIKGIQNEQVPEGIESKYFSKTSLDGLKEIAKEELNSEIAVRKIRAFDFPGHEPAYTIIQGHKIELRYGR